MEYVLDNLAVGSFDEAAAPPSEIDALLCVAGEKDLPAVRRLYGKVPMEDMQPIPAGLMADAVRFIEGAIGSHKILVFCNAGVGRAPSVVIGYLCCAMGFRFGDAVELVALKKPYMSILPDLILTIERTKAILSGTPAPSSG